MRRPVQPRRWVLAALITGGLAAAPALATVPAAADPSTTSATAEPRTATTSSSGSSSGSSASGESPTPSSSDSATPPAPSSATSSTTSSTGSSTGSSTPARSISRAASGAPFSLAVSSIGSPKAGTFYQDIGSFGFSGTVADRSPGQAVEIWRSNSGGKAWGRVAATRTGATGTYSAGLKVTWTSASLRFCATLGGSPASASTIKTCPAPVVVHESSVTISTKLGSLNALKDPTVSGSVSPARAGVKINIDVKRSDGKYRAATSATTAANGTWRASLGYGHGSLKTYRVRAAFHAANRDRWETSSSQSFERTAVLDAKVYKTTAADVAKTYRSGCPVGPSKLRTIALNYYGMGDHKMHRGVIIIRSSLSDDLVRAFGAALKKRYPIAKMYNPNVYGGNDPKQMEANNTSGFNCRKVTGNPYAQSPHSYGTALDVNTVQNPYRDVHGKWWPKNGKSYIDRSPLRTGMLGKNSTLTKSLRKDKFFWGGFWNPGRDYQHFQR